jgi:hypothetical protein
VTRSLGKNQLARLKSLAHPETYLIVGDRAADSLARRGLLRAFGKGRKSFFGITPAGLRALADALEERRCARNLPGKRKP